MMKRFISLDVLRGMTIIAMIIANCPGYLGQFSMFRHVSWNGCTIADFVLTFFLFIVGASFWFSSKKSSGELDMIKFGMLMKRGALLFIFGLLFNWFPFNAHWTEIRVPGVLQRIAFVFVLGGVLCLWLKSYPKLISASLLILVGYGAYLGISGVTDAEVAKDSFLGKADAFVFRGASYYKPFDPEGIVSNFSAIVNMLFGYMVARYLDQSTQKLKAMIVLSVIGGACICLALFAETWIPINKRLWSPTYVLYTCGWATVVWMLFIGLIDVLGWKKWSVPFQVFGANALFIYLMSPVLPYFAAKWGVPFAINGLWLVALCGLIAYPLYRYRIFIKV